MKKMDWACGLGFALLFFWPLILRAEVHGDFEYEVEGQTVSITGYRGSGGVVEIPAGILGRAVTAIGESAFANTWGITHVTIPHGLITIRNMAFYDCEDMTSVAIPASVTTIGDSAFAWCFSLEGATIPDSVSTIGAVAFGGCMSLDSVVIGNNVTAIGGYAFSGCSSLTSITIPASVLSIGDSVFYQCPRLASIDVHPLNPQFSSIDGMLANKARTNIIQCPSSKTGHLYIPDGVITIGDRSFEQCKLSGVTIPDSVLTIGEWAFSGCMGLKSLWIGDNVLTIGKQAFSGCMNLVRATIPDRVLTIGDQAFYSCENLNSVTIGKEVISIGDSAFSLCSSLTGAFFTGDAPSHGVQAFGVPAVIHYLANTDGWGDTYAGRPTALWVMPPSIKNPRQGPFGFSFTITGTPFQEVFVEACTDPGKGDWEWFGNYTLVEGSFDFFDADSGDYPSRCYRVKVGSRP